jgi:hypothetical protein
MKRFIIAAAVAVLPAVYAGSAAAESQLEQEYAPAERITTKTRAEVIAELKAAQASGEYAQLNSTNPTFAWDASSKSRAEVRAETRAARARGELDLADHNGPLAHTPGAVRSL